MTVVLLLTLAVLLFTAGLGGMIAGVCRRRKLVTLGGYLVFVAALIPFAFGLALNGAQQRDTVAAAVHAGYGATVVGGEHGGGTFTLRLPDGSLRRCEVTGPDRSPVVSCLTPLPHRHPRTSPRPHR